MGDGESIYERGLGGTIAQDEREQRPDPQQLTPRRAGRPVAVAGRLRWLAAVAGRASLPVCLAGYAVSATGCGVLAVTGRAHLIDLRVYRMGGRVALHGGSLYGLRYAGLPFTYPPFAAGPFAGFAALPWVPAAALITVASVVALPALLYLALRLEPVRSWLDRGSAVRLALAAGAVAVWLEPVRSALGYGQIDLFLAAAVLYDLALPATARRKGVAIGLAAGIKLTPVIFLLYLLATRRWRAAATAAGVLAATVATGWIVLPSASARYWDGMFLSPRHISPIQDPQNESLLGALARTLHTAHVQHVWLPVALAVAAAGLTLAARAQRRGNEAAGFSLCAVTGLLVSPISWTHHWVVAVPALLIAAVTVGRGWAGMGYTRRTLSLAALAGLAACGWARLARHAPSGHWLHLPVPQLLASEIYVLAGLVTLGLAATLALRLGAR